MELIWIVIKILSLIIFLSALLHALLDIIEVLIDWRWHRYGLRSNQIPRSVLQNLRSISRSEPGRYAKIKEFKLTGIYVELGDNDKPYGEYSFHFQDNLGSQYQIGESHHSGKILRSFMNYISYLLFTLFVSAIGILNPTGTILYFRHRIKEIYEKLYQDQKIITKKSGELRDSTTNSPVSVMKIYSELNFKKELNNT